MASYIKKLIKAKQKFALPIRTPGFMVGYLSSGALVHQLDPKYIYRYFGKNFDLSLLCETIDKYFMLI
jgi:hypothetical protein